MRIAYLLPDPGIPVGGTKGASVHVAEVCATMARRDITVHLFAQRAARPEATGPDGVEVTVLDPGPIPKDGRADLVRMAAGRDFARRCPPLVRQFRPNVIYERLSFMAGGFADLAGELGVPRLVEVNAPVVDEWATQRPLHLPETAQRLQRQALEGAQVAAVSPPLAQWALAGGAARAVVVPNGVDLGRFAPADAPAAARRAELGLDGADVVGFVGSLKPWHGVDVLLAAVERLVPDHPRLVVLVVGDGPMRAALVDQAGRGALAGRVRFVGAVPASDVPSYVHAMDVAVAPYLPRVGSGSEAATDFYFSPLKVAEAMAAGRAVVASKVPTIESMLGGTGALVPPGDAGALAAALAGLLGDPVRRTWLGEQARRRAERELSWDRAVDATLALAGSTAGSAVEAALSRAR